MCFAHEKWEITARQVSCFLEILLFPFSLYFCFFFLSLKFLERIQMQIRKHLATPSQSWSCLRRHSQGRGRKELPSQLTLYMALGSPASKERGVNTHFAGSAGLGELAKAVSHRRDEDAGTWPCALVMLNFPPHCLCFLLVPFTQHNYLYQWVKSRISLRSTASVNVMMDGMPSEGESSHGEIGLLGFYKSFACHQPGERRIR